MSKIKSFKSFISESNKIEGDSIPTKIVDHLTQSLKTVAKNANLQLVGDIKVSSSFEF